MGPFWVRSLMCAASRTGWWSAVQASGLTANAGGRHPTHLRNPNGLLARHRWPTALQPVCVHAAHHARRLWRPEHPNPYSSARAAICPGAAPRSSPPRRPERRAHLAARTDRHRRLHPPAGPHQPRILPPGTSSACAPPSWPRSTLTAKPHRTAGWLFEASPAMTTTCCCCTAPGCCPPAPHLQLLAKTINQGGPHPRTVGQMYPRPASGCLDQFYRAYRRTPQRHRQLLHQRRTGGPCARF